MNGMFGFLKNWNHRKTIWSLLAIGVGAAAVGLTQQRMRMGRRRNLPFHQLHKKLRSG
ncbi:DUF3918 family protein [Paenibacillus popilliae]|uniref:DUF3918 family protein n=1 Tax=Paenibacillus popilliae TaxID=78057 RepID=UPI0002FE305A|nr:DUF3918 family protein [Paenibacillus popilliae]